MLRIRSANGAMKLGVKMRMKPASTTRPGSNEATNSASAQS
jgi:hypothetical protein